MIMVILYVDDIGDDSYIKTIPGVSDKWLEKSNLDLLGLVPSEAHVRSITFISSDVVVKEVKYKNKIAHGIHRFDIF